MNQRFKIILPLFIVFSIFTLAFICGNFFLTRSGVDFTVLMVSNCLFFFMSLIAINMQLRAMGNKNPNVFIRSVMGSMMLKMFVCIAAVMAYVLGSGKIFNKPSVYISMAIYLVYLVVEVTLVTKLNKRKNA